MKTSSFAVVCGQLRWRFSSVCARLTRLCLVRRKLLCGRWFQVVSDDHGKYEVAAAGRLSDHLSLGVIARIYRRDVVEEMILLAGRREQRERLLPARLVVY